MLAPLGPFERAPELAVAVSGGADSLALCLLAAEWAEARGGRVTALTVDHGLRAESAGEAKQVAAWLDARGIAHVVLRWQGPKPVRGLQAAARAARYRLLEAWCRQHRVLHLLLAHHADDQAETVAMRLERASGMLGLAGMAPVRELSGLRLLRPLLPVPGARLRATLRARGQPWIEDPSNLDPAFRRARLRRRGALDRAGLLATASRAAKARRALERDSAGFFARHAMIHPAGFLWLDQRAWREAPEALARLVLERALIAIGGRPYPPRSARLLPLVQALRGADPPAARTLSGCLLRIQGGRLLVVREPDAVREQLELAPGGEVVFDGRFLVRYQAGPVRLLLRRLGAEGWRWLRATGRAGPLPRLPHAVRLGLPALWRTAAGRRLDRPLAVHHVDLAVGASEELPRAAMRFRPMLPPGGAPFGDDEVASTGA